MGRSLCGSCRQDPVPEENVLFSVIVRARVFGGHRDRVRACRLGRFGVQRRRFRGALLERFGSVGRNGLVERVLLAGSMWWSLLSWFSLGAPISISGPDTRRLLP